jgi:hypothetical protein
LTPASQLRSFNVFSDADPFRTGIDSSGYVCVLDDAVAQQLEQWDG